VRRRLAEICEGLPLRVTGAGSLFKITATGAAIRNYRDAATANKRWEQVASLALLNEGFLLTTSCSGCVSTVTTEDEIDAFLRAVERVVNL
jgi:glutamate-1-semialdehyde aminotransferase